LCSFAHFDNYSRVQSRLLAFAMRSGDAYGKPWSTTASGHKAFPQPAESLRQSLHLPQI
jgi:hypothetical protein